MRNNEQGRSMIEMLGVLAIVGVLSVGGIAGYSKAMGKFKTNKLIDQINMVTTNVRTLFATQPDYGGLTNALAKQVNLVPAEMYTSADDDAITNAFGGAMNIQPSKVNSGEEDGHEKGYIVSVDNIPSTACVVIVTTDWGSDSDSGLVGMFATTQAGSAVSTLDAYTIDANAEEGEGEGEAVGDGVHTPTNGIPYNVVDTNASCGVNQMTEIAWKYM